jgi:hypothetical protein
MRKNASSPGAENSEWTTQEIRNARPPMGSCPRKRLRPCAGISANGAG